MEFNIVKGFALRFVLTLGTFTYLPFFKLDKHYYILLPLLLTLLDFTDNVFTHIFTTKMQYLSNNRFYQLQDKIIDSLSYILVWYVFKLNPIFLYLVLYRLIGVYIFYHTNDKKIFVLFPDVFKEFLFLTGFKLNNSIYSIVFILKMVIEYFFNSICQFFISKF
jgi:hypothetical protein